MKKVFFAALFSLTAAAFLAAGYLLKQKSSLPVYGHFPDFKLTEKSGKEISASDLKGKVWIVDFIFTRCAGQCPMMSGKMVELQENLKGIHFISFTVDPEYDMPEKLSVYAKICSADPARWFFLTGKREMLDLVTTGLHMNKLGDPMMHSASFVLVDKNGDVRGYYDANDSERLKQLKKDALSLF